ncbi:hypothetical protein O181_056496 [Austropuccinia psidii MF-1]|uniref:Reverse transcriptase RNase H-like domain-containing protein n=1 Tax=Austropuccinia psidii MF-1 TaxID=1389203 RepID=A0A9Q3E6G0_9BASI|nr:hypothetical protein [Austropuccinia psidii MF-1]
MLTKNRPSFVIGEESLGKIRGHDIKFYLNVERPNPPILRRPPYPGSLETRKEIEKNINELLEMDFIMKIGHNERVQALGVALQQRKILDGDSTEGVIFCISRKLKDSEARYGANQIEHLCLVWALEKLHYYLECAVFEMYTDCTAWKPLLNMTATNRQMLSWQIAIQEYRRNMTIIYKERKSHTNADGN